MTPRRDKEPRDKDAVDRSPFVPRGRMPDPFTLAIFGATGDLAAWKLLPAVFALACGQFLPADFIGVGMGRRAKDDAAFREDVRKLLAASPTDAPSEEVDDFLGRVFYHRADFTTAAGLAEQNKELNKTKTCVPVVSSQFHGSGVVLPGHLLSAQQVPGGRRGLRPHQSIYLASRSTGIPGPMALSTKGPAAPACSREEQQARLQNSSTCLFCWPHRNAWDDLPGFGC